MLNNLLVDDFTKAKWVAVTIDKDDNDSFPDDEVPLLIEDYTSEHAVLSEFFMSNSTKTADIPSCTNLFVKHASQKGLIIVLSALWQIPSSTDVKFRIPGEVLSRSGRIVFSKVYKDPPALTIN